MATAKPKIKCRVCDGKGYREVSPPYARCLMILGRLRQATVLEIFDRLKEKVDITAVNNRMRRMVEMGLVRRINHHKPWKYQIVWK